MDETVKTAKDGYFLAKREMVEAIDGRMDRLEKELNLLEEKSEEIKTEMRALERMRSYVRNVMLWNDDRVK